MVNEVEDAGGDGAHGLVGRGRPSQELITRLYESHATALLRYARRLCGGSQEQAEDVVAEVFVTVMRKGTTFNPSLGLSERGWLFGITKKEVQRLRAKDLSWWRKLRKVEDVTSRDEADDVDVAGAVVDALVWQARLDLEWSRLSERDREALKLFLDEHSYAEIGVRLGIPAGTVGSRLHRVKQQLSRRLRAAGSDLIDYEE